MAGGVAVASATALLAELQGLALRRLALLVGDVQGLTVAARAAKRGGRISAATARRLERIDVSAHYSRHITDAKVALFTGELESELRWGPRPAARAPGRQRPPSTEDPWHTGSDPWAPAVPADVGGAPWPGSGPDAAQADRDVEALGAQCGVPPKAPLVEDGTQTELALTRSIGTITSRPRRASCGAQAGPPPDDNSEEPDDEYLPEHDVPYLQHVSSIVAVQPASRDTVASFALAASDPGVGTAHRDSLPRVPSSSLASVSSGSGAQAASLAGGSGGVPRCALCGSLAVEHHDPSLPGLLCRSCYQWRGDPSWHSSPWWKRGRKRCGQ